MLRIITLSVFFVCSLASGAPDLVVEDVWTDPAVVTASQAYVIYGRIRNIGDSVASVTIGSQEARFMGSSGAEYVAYDDVPPGGMVVVQSKTLTGPLAVGSHGVSVEADYYDEVVEELETNNNRTEFINVIAPDLVVHSITINPGYAWRPTTITAVIRNDGEAPAEFEQFDRVCSFHVDGLVEYDTLLLSPLSILPGGTYVSEATFIVSSLGSFSVVAAADPSQEIIEALENNNLRAEFEIWTASPIHDTDGDGMVDADEVLAGCEPDNSNSIWQCSMVLTNGGFRLSWPSVSGRTYTVMRTTNLTNDFIAITPPLPAVPPENWLESVNMPSNAFYRVEVK